jgi:hypothetical protein
MKNNSIKDYNIQEGGSKLLFINLLLPNGRKAFYYLICQYHKLDALKNMLNLGRQMNLTDFGNVVASGWNEPDIATMRQLEAQYKVKLI